eukprot:4515995-Prymnesium_polylepis.1
MDHIKVTASGNPIGTTIAQTWIDTTTLWYNWVSMEDLEGPYLDLQKAAVTTMYGANAFYAYGYPMG